jgi:hypothetical protein
MPNIRVQFAVSPCPNCTDGHLRMPPASNMEWWPVDYAVDISMMCWSCGYQKPAVLEPDGIVREP